MRRSPRLTPAQWKTLASVCSNIGQAVILFSLAAFFVPQTVNLPENFSREFPIITLLEGLILVAAAVIISKKGK